MDDAVQKVDRVEVSNHLIVALPVAVQRPNPPESVDGNPPSARIRFEFEQRAQDAERLRNLLQASGLVPAVGWTADFPGQRVVVIRALPSPPAEGGDDEDNILWFVTDMILPSVRKTNRGVFFRRVNVDAPEFRCDWRITSVKSVFLALPALFLPRWHVLEEPEIPMYKLRRCLVEQSSVLMPPG